VSATTMTALGIDPGLAATGFGVVDGDRRRLAVRHFDCLRTASGDPLSARLARIHEGIAAALATWRPDLAVIEKVWSLPRVPTSALLLAHVRGVICLAVAQAGCELMEVSPNEVKAALTGSGHADKEQVERAVRQELELRAPVRPSHAADALALAVVGLRRSAGSADGRRR
jgi:crossover junction endodeoxyribonuclease RuvC